METKKSPAELEIKLLWDLANAVPQDNYTRQLLRSYYLTVCKKIGRRDVQLPPGNFAPSVMCPKCSSIWLQSKFSLKLKPQRFKNAKAQKLVEALNTDSKSLNKKQRIRAKWLKKRVTSNVEIKCGFCQKKTLQRLIKRKKAKVEEPEPVVDASIKKKNKKKAKDKTAGLKLNKVMPPRVKSDPEEIKPIPQKKKDNPQQTKSCLEQVKFKQQQPKPNPPKKSKNQKVQPPKGKVVKVISNTQKQNSLLQLANLLKNRSPAVSSTSNNQLSKLLR